VYRNSNPMMIGSAKYNSDELAIPPPDTCSPFSSVCTPTNDEAVISVNDVFFTRQWGNVLDTPTLYQENFRRREMRFVRFTLTWKFGEQNTSLFRKRGERPRNEPGSGGGDMEM
jgi:hypothetical protein